MVYKFYICMKIQNIYHNSLLYKKPAISFGTQKEDAKSYISSLKIQDKEKLKLINKALEKSDIMPETTLETIKNFINELLNIKNLNTLKKVIKGGVKFRFALGNAPAVYVARYKKGTIAQKEIIFSQDSNGDCSLHSLAHELGHAFDYETKIKKSGLTYDLEYDVIKDENGNYVKSKDYMPNSTSYALVKESNGVYCAKIIGEIEDCASLSKEFEQAFTKDYIRLLDLDKENGKIEGSTFQTLLSDWNLNSGFAYYLGASKDKAEIEDTSKLKKELFAQMAALVTNGSTPQKEFDKKATLYFPNTFEFVNHIISTLS